MKPHRRPISDVLAPQPTPDMVELAKKVIAASQAANADDLDETALLELAVLDAARMKAARK